MKTEVKKLENCLVEVTAVFDGDEWKDAQDKALDKLAATVKMDGFRQGKTPKGLLKQRLGNQAIFNEAVDIILENSYSRIFTENEVFPVAQPEARVEETTKEMMKVVFTAPVAPEVELKQYKDLDVKKAEVEVTDEDVDARIKQLQEEYSELEIKEDGQVEEGDTAVIDFEGFLDGEAFEGGKGENHSLEIGSHTFIPGFEEQLVGMNAGEEKEITVTFPEDYQAEDLAGKETVFKVKVNEIKKKILPAIDDDLALDANIDDVETLDQLKEYYKKQILEQKQYEADNNFENDVFEALVEANPLEVPEAMVETEVQQMVSEINQNFANQGITMELYQQITGQTMDDIKESVKDQAEKRVKFQLILNEIVKAENIEVTDEEYEDELKELATYYNRDFEELKQLFTGQEFRIKGDVAARKAVDFVKDNVAK